MVCTTSTPCRHAAVDHRHAEKRLIVFLARFAEIFEARMRFHLMHGDRPHLFRHQSGKSFVQTQAQRTDALRPQADGGGQHEIGAVRLQQIGGANVGLEAPRDQRHNVHQSFGRLAAFLGQVADFLHGQNVMVCMRW